MAIDSSGPRHTIIAAFPSGGWSLRFDHVDGGIGAYLTAIRPDPESPRTEALVEQRVDSTIRSSRACRVYLRTAEFASLPGDYALVAEAPGR